MKIIQTDEKDFPAMIEIAKNDGFSHPNQLNTDWLKKRLSEGDIFFITEEKNGFVSLQKKFASGAKLHFLSVKKQAQHKGIGTALIKKIEEETKKLGFKKLFLYSHQKNFDAIRFYTKLQFYVDGIFIDKYGPGQNAILMCKDLE